MANTYEAFGIDGEGEVYTIDGCADRLTLEEALKLARDLRTFDLETGHSPVNIFVNESLTDEKIGAEHTVIIYSLFCHKEISGVFIKRLVD